jgi:hypothetical protein
MIEMLGRYPFLLPLLGALVIELSSILMRKAAQVLGRGIWIFSGLLSIAGGVVLIWSLIWANIPEKTVLTGSLFSSLVGPLLVLSGVVWVIRSLLILGRQAFFPWPPTSIIDEAPYQARRRPMVLGILMLATGLALTMSRIEGWIWATTWFVLAQPILEAEEWELRTRLPEAQPYFKRTPRYFKWPSLRS